MKISIITPTHDVKYLKELEDTILSQTHSDWEWVVMLNHGASFDCAQDARIKKIECPFENDSVGLLKKLACMQATGEVIAEVDHDDLLVPECLEKVAQAFEDPEVGFVYSRNAKLTDKPMTYLPEYGWTADKFRWGKKSLYAPFNQPVYPGRLGYIWFAPDHIRAWKRDVYDSIGGHDDSLKVCDDLDLMHRLYVATKFKEIPEVLYVYRITGDNTYVKKGDLIKEKNRELYDRNIDALARRFAILNGLSIIDMSDRETDFQPGISYPDNSVGLIIAKDTLQSIVDTRRFMNEVHRVLAPGGLFISETPSTDGRGAFQDPRNISFWNENSFWYYTKPGYANKIRNTKMFRACKLSTEYPDEFHKQNKMPYVIAHLEKI